MKSSLFACTLLLLILHPVNAQQIVPIIEESYSEEGVIEAVHRGMNDQLIKWGEEERNLEVYTYPRNMSTLMVAAKKGLLDVARTLIKYGASVDYKDMRNNSILYYSMHDPQMTQLLLDAGADPRGTVQQTNTPVISYYAAFSENHLALKALIDAGADPAVLDAESDSTPLLFAVMNQNVETTRVLLDLYKDGVDILPFYIRSNYKSAYGMAEERNNEEMINLLRSYGIDR